MRFGSPPPIRAANGGEGLGVGGLRFEIPPTPGPSPPLASARGGRGAAPPNLWRGFDAKRRRLSAPRERHQAVERGLPVELRDQIGNLVGGACTQRRLRALAEFAGDEFRLEGAFAARALGER